MRNMSFSATKEQVRLQTKDVTRRIGWAFLKPGDVVQPIEKGQGLKKGEKVVKIGPPIRILANAPEQIDAINKSDCIREGFPDRTPESFMAHFCAMNNCPRYQVVNRIEFEDLEEMT